MKPLGWVTLEISHTTGGRNTLNLLVRRTVLIRAVVGRSGGTFAFAPLFCH